MPQRRLIQIDSTTVSASYWRNGSLREELRLAATAENVTPFADYLAQHPSSLFYLLADVAEEGFVAETVPFVRGADREAMLQRKLSQLYYGSPYAATQSLGREKSGRRDEHVLFLALNRPQFFEPWLAATRSAEAQIGGLYTVPFVAEQLVGRLNVKAERLLLLSIGRAGVRQIFFAGGRARFSRLTPIPLSNVQDAAQACGTEAAKLHQYLISQRLVARSAQLPTLVLTHPSWQTTFAESCRSSEELRFDLVDLPSVAQACGLKRPIEDFIADPLYLHLLAQKPPDLQFAPAPERRNFQLWQARSTMTAVGAVAMLGCLLFSAKQLVDAGQLRQDTALKLAQTQTHEQSYRALLKSLPAMPTSLDNLRGVIARYGEVERRSAAPDALLAEISRTLDRMPEIEVDSIEWLLTATPEEVSSSAAERRVAAAGPREGAEPAAMFGVAVVSGELPAALALDQRGQIDTVDALVASLRQNPQLQVKVLRQPVDFQSGTLLRGGVDSRETRESPRFSLQVSYKL